jgi:hypothetical protein
VSGQSARVIAERLPVVGRPMLGIGRRLRRLAFPGSSRYWENRYRGGRSSGPGSEGPLAAFKAEVLNAFVKSHAIGSVIEFGCGDGSQLMLAEYPRYVGLDVSATALRRCIDRFEGDPSKSFFLYDPYAFSDGAGILSAEVALSIDVIYHLVEDRIFDLSMRHLFASGQRFVIVYSSNMEGPGRSPHVRHRRFTTWVERNAPGWRLVDTVANRYPRTEEGTGSPSDFYVFGRDE